MAHTRSSPLAQQPRSQLFRSVPSPLLRLLASAATAFHLSAAAFLSTPKRSTFKASALSMVGPIIKPTRISSLNVFIFIVNYVDFLHFMTYVFLINT